MRIQKALTVALLVLAACSTSEDSTAVVTEVSTTPVPTTAVTTTAVPTTAVPTTAVPTTAAPTTAAPTTPAAPPSTTVGVFEGPGGLPTGLYAGEGNELDAWPVYIEFRDDGTGRLLLSGSAIRSNSVDTQDGTISNSAVLEFDYRVDDDRLTLVNRAGDLGDCASPADATYEWGLDGPWLRLTAVDEPCRSVTAGLPPRWRGLEHPLNEWQLSPRAAVDTSLGTIEWTTAELGERVGSVQELAGELVGISSGDGMSPHIVRSTDGISWTPIPSPPDPPGIPDGLARPASLAVRGELLYESSSLGGMAPFLGSVYATDDWGATWRELPLEPAPTNPLLNTMQIVAGDAGVIVTTGETFAEPFDDEPVIGPIWVLGDAGFERVEAPFTGLTGPSERLQVWAVDSGFFVNKGAALGGDQLSGANAWFSPDGRTWTEVVDLPQQLMVTTAVGDTVYGVAQAAGVADADVISTDGGRTWTDAPERPTAVPPLPMAVDDQGFVTGAVADIGVVWVSADGVTWERAMNLWPPITIGAEPAWVNRDTMLLIIWETAVIGRIS